MLREIATQFRARTEGAPYQIHVDREPLAQLIKKNDFYFYGDDADTEVSVSFLTGRNWSPNDAVELTNMLLSCWPEEDRSHTFEQSDFNEEWRMNTVKISRISREYHEPDRT
jgi:hypothetical protein